MTRALTFLHVPEMAMGYGRAGTMLRRALEQAGIDIYTDLGQPAETMSPSEASRARGRIAVPPTNTAMWVAGPSHVKGWWDAQHKVVLTMWEASRIPESFRENLHEIDQLIVPSMHNVELFSQYHDDVSYVPLGIDPDDWHYVPRTEPGATFRFLIGGSGERKGTDLAFKAFKTVFGAGFDDEGRWTRSGPAPVLVMKNPRGEDFFAPWVEMISGKIPADMEIALYATAHCYVQPSKGEGFGLQPLQALAQGCPTILTDAHGHASFAQYGIGLPWAWSKAAYFTYGDAGEWWEPDFEALCEAMADVYTNYPAHAERAKANAVIVGEKFTWDRCAQEVLEIIGPHLDQPYTGTGTWQTATTHFYPVIVNQQVSLDAAGEAFMFEVGECQRCDGVGCDACVHTGKRTYWERADIKRNLFDGNKLDRACLTGYQVGDDCGTMDVGLNVEQVSQIPDYSARHSYCPLCRQRLNTQPTRADDIEAELAAG